MTDRRPRIVFMGTPEFAVASLEAIINAEFNVVAVVTAPDKPSGRGKKLSKSPVKAYAIDKNIKVLDPIKLKDEYFISALKELDADLFIVVAFRMLPKEVWSIPKKGTFNGHASLLPQYRGAAPINHVIINGERVTGVTTFLIDENIDTGEILFRSSKLPIKPEETAEKLHDRLMKACARLVVKTAKKIIEGEIKRINQKISLRHYNKIHYAPKITQDFLFIKWSRSSIEVHNLIRGLSTSPGARTIIASGEKKITIKILGSKLADYYLQPGEIKVINKQVLVIGCLEGAIEVTSIQAEGRKQMLTTDFLNGFDISAWHTVTE